MCFVLYILPPHNIYAIGEANITFRTIKAPPEAGGDIDEVLPLKDACTRFGRSAAHAEIVLRDDAISRQHAAIVHAEKDSYLFDLGSATGTFVDDVRVRPEQHVKLSDGVAITLGTNRATYTFRVAPKAAAVGGGGGGGKRKR